MVFRTPNRRSLVMLATAWLAALASLAAQQPEAPSATAMDSTADYRLQRGDELTIKVFGRPELDDTVIVRPDGRISAALVDDVEAAGLTVSALDVTLTTRLEKFFKDPRVTVIVRRVANLKVFVGGEVAQPGVIAITGDLTALAAVYQAGGFRASARPDSVVLLRSGGDGKVVATRLDLKRMNTGDALRTLQPHDVLFVPMSRIAKVDRFVDQYARQLIPISLTAGFSYVLGDAFRP